MAKKGVRVKVYLIDLYCYFLYFLTKNWRFSIAFGGVAMIRATNLSISSPDT